VPPMRTPPTMSVEAIINLKTAFNASIVTHLLSRIV
jgi:hypothetical protein